MVYCCPECSITLPEKTRDCPECEWVEESDDDDTQDSGYRFMGARPSTRGTQRDKSVRREPVYSIMEDRDFSLSSPHTRPAKEDTDEVDSTSFIEPGSFTPRESRLVTIKKGASDEEVALLLDRDYSYTPPKPDNSQ
jgi:hypothetical protein